jgi:hypothetical protein
LGRQGPEGEGGGGLRIHGADFLDEAAAKQKQPEERLRDVSDEKKPALQKLIKDFDGEIVRYQT